MKKILRVFIIVISLPLIGSLLVKPPKTARDTTQSDAAKNDASAINSAFLVTVHESRGDFYYAPEKIVELMVAAQIPEEIVFSQGEDYVETASQSAYDSEQEYLKALAIVLRTNLVYEWEREGRPENLDLDSTGLCIQELRTDTDGEDADKKKEIERAVAFTYGAVITKEKNVIAAPFFTSSQGSLLVEEAGEGDGFSLNYAYFLAQDGMDFYKILQRFYDGISVVIYE
jgi:Sporulation protein and related proteins